MFKDTQIHQLVAKELERQREGIELIASENFASHEVVKTMGSVLTNKYAEGYPGKRYYGGCEIVDEIEQIAIDRLKQIFDCEYANVQPHSGAQANAAVFLAILQPGEAILGLDLSMGGHLTHGSPVNFSGKIYIVLTNRIAQGNKHFIITDNFPGKINSMPRSISYVLIYKTTLKTGVFI